VPLPNILRASSTAAPCFTPCSAALYISPKKSVTKFLPRVLSIAVSSSLEIILPVGRGLNV